MSTPVRIALIVAGGLVALIASVFVIGLLLPRTHRATSEIVIAAPVDSVYGALRDIGNMPTWWPELTVSERVPDVSGERWRQTAGGFEMQLDVTDDSPPTGFITRIVETPGAPFGGVWRYTLEPTDSGTRVQITEDGWIGPPPFRVMANLTGLHRTIDAMLTALGTRFGQTVTPVHR